MDRALVVLLSLCVIYLHVTSNPGGPPKAPDCPVCPKKSCPACVCAKSSVESPCANISRGLSGLLSELSTLPKGIVSNTNPAVFVATNYPSLTYLQLQQDMASFELLRAIAVRIGAITTQRVMDMTDKQNRSAQGP